VEREVVSSKIALELHESLNNEFLNFTALLEGVARGELEATDGTASSAAGGQDVFSSGVHLPLAEVIGVHVSGVGVPRLVTIVAFVNDVVKERGELGVRFLITGNDTAGLNMGVTLVINSCLDAMSEGASQLGLLGGKAFVETGVRLKSISHEVAVVRQVGAFIGHNFGGEGGSLFGADVLGGTTSKTDEVRKSKHVGAKTFWGIVGVSERYLGLVVKEVSANKGGSGSHEHP